MDLNIETLVWIAHHLPEIVYELLYIGQPRDKFSLFQKIKAFLWTTWFTMHNPLL